MTIKIKQLTKRQLVDYIKPYRDSFPDWSVEHDVVLTRMKGPIKQHIGFQALSHGAIRPSCSVELLIVPGVRILNRLLDVKNREVLPRDHPTKWQRVVRAMEDEFQPSIRKPLEVTEVLRLGEEEVSRDQINNINYLSGLAALNTYVGNAERGLHWCDRIEGNLKSLGREPADWERNIEKFVCQLRDAIGKGQAYVQ